MPRIKELGGDLIAISPELTDHTLTMAEKHQIPIDVVSDGNGGVLKRYRLWFAVSAEIKELYRDKFGINLDKYNGEGRWELPVPATYVLDGQGIVRAGVADPDHTVRMDIEEILTTLTTIRGGK